MTTINDLLENVFNLIDSEPVYSSLDEWGKIYINEAGDYRSMKFDLLYEQSKMLLSNPSYPVFNYVRAMLFSLTFGKVQHVLHLGLGGGSLVKAIHRLNPAIEQTVIELRPKVIALAKQYFFVPETQAIQLQCADARHYLAVADNAVDVIFADMYMACHMDPIQLQSEFIHHCRRLLPPSGWLVINYTEHDAIDDILVSELYRYFDDILLCCLANGNVVLYAGRLPASWNLDMLANAVADFEQKLNCKIGILAKLITRLPEPAISTTNENGHQHYGKENSTPDCSDRSG